MTERYESPTLTEIGSLHDLTLFTLEKRGNKSDALTNIPGLGGPTGSIVVTEP